MNPQYTLECEVSELDRDGIVVVTSLSPHEERGSWWTSFSRAKTFPVFSIGNPVLEFRIGPKTYQVRSRTDLELLLEIWSELGEIHIDLTTLPYEVWASLIRQAVLKKISIKAVYVEPKKYKQVAKQDALREFDLSSEIHGIENLPGFSQLALDDEPFALVVMLGFEGARFGYLTENVGAERASKLVPIIGVPGFRPEFVRYAYEGNIHTLIQTKTARSVRFARANCPFSAFRRIQEISLEISEPLLKFGLIGTRPHGLGAVLFSLLSRRKTSLLFDFPTRRADRTEGMGKILVYDLGKFCKETGNVS